MLIHESKSAAESDAFKEVKVKIPSRYHMILMSMKMLHGRPISDVVTSALEEYFASLNGPPADPVDEAAAEPVPVPVAAQVVAATPARPAVIIRRTTNA